MDAFSHRTSSYGRAPLRIGVLINGSRQPAWVAEVLEQISKRNFARLELAVWNAEWAPKRPMLLKLIEALRSEKQRQQYWTNFRGTTLVVNPYDQKQHCDGYGSSDRANYGGLGHS